MEDQWAKANRLRPHSWGKESAVAILNDYGRTGSSGQKQESSPTLSCSSLPGLLLHTHADTHTDGSFAGFPLECCSSNETGWDQGPGIPSQFHCQGCDLDISLEQWFLTCGFWSYWGSPLISCSTCGCHQISCISDIYVMTHKISKITVMNDS